MHPAHFLGHSSQRSVALERVIILPDTRCVPDHALLELVRHFAEFLRPAAELRSYFCLLFYPMSQQEA